MHSWIYYFTHDMGFVVYICEECKSLAFINFYEDRVDYSFQGQTFADINPPTDCMEIKMMLLLK